MVLLCASETVSEIETQSADVTFAGDTSELPAGVRCITVPLADELETRLVLYFLSIAREEAGKQEWSAGFYLERRYDCEPYDPVHEERPDPDPSEEFCYAWLGDAVISAVERAAWWLTANSDGEDRAGRWKKTDDALEEWKEEFDYETATEGIFDDPSDEEASVVADGPAGEEETVSPVEQLAVAAAVSDESAKLSLEYHQKKTHLEQIISKTVIEQIRFKAALKQCNESLRTYGDELAELEIAWNKPLPLFDKQPVKEAGESVAAMPLDESAPNPWRAAKISDLKNLTPKIVEILDAENIRTIGDWVDWPAKHPGVEYTQISNSAGKITEKRYEKLVAAMDGAVMANS